MDDARFREAFIRAARLARDRTDKALAAHGVRAGQQFTLRALWDEDGLTPGELARRIGVEKPTIVRGLGRMEAAGLVARRPDPDDGRLVRVWLTARGRALREVVPALEDRIVDEGLAGFSADERRQFTGYVERLLANLARAS